MRVGIVALRITPDMRCDELSRSVSFARRPIAAFGAFPSQGMPRTKKPVSRARSRQANLDRLENAAELYLAACYENQTAARGDEFANYLRVARPYLSRLVPQLTGMSVRDYLRAKQLAYAQRLLRTTPSSIDVIARKSAFGTSWTFNRCFRQAFGMTPTAYRKVTK